jgi:hypothetical protein
MPEMECAFCGAPSTLLCDGIISPPEQVTHRRTCDKRICREHAKTVAFRMLGAKPIRDGTIPRDLCPDCVKAGRSAF